jgi:ABC-type nitrate/sulfonate/bicarbonate transport system substrate-binding protein
MLNRLKGVFASFQKHDVKYLVIGGIASILYGVPRVTFDLDLFIEATPANAQKFLTALVEAEMRTATLTTAEELLSNEITVFKDRVRIDVQTSTPSFSFQDVWKRREWMVYQEQEFYVISKHDLIATKRASGREIDLSDVRLLEISEEEKD